MHRAIQFELTAARATSIGTVVVLIAREDLAMARGTVWTNALPEAMSRETVRRYIIFTVGKIKWRIWLHLNIRATSLLQALGARERERVHKK
jgi:hypothetical protein